MPPIPSLFAKRNNEASKTEVVREKIIASQYRSAAAEGLGRREPSAESSGMALHRRLTLQLHSGPLSTIRAATPPSRNGLSHVNRERSAEMAEQLLWSTLDHLKVSVTRSFQLPTSIRREQKLFTNKMYKFSQL